MEQEAYQETIELQLVEKEEDDLEKIKEESRRRRQAILEKYKNKKSQQPETNVKGTVMPCCFAFSCYIQLILVTSLLFCYLTLDQENIRLISCGMGSIDIKYGDLGIFLLEEVLSIALLKS